MQLVTIRSGSAKQKDSLEPKDITHISRDTKLAIFIFEPGCIIPERNYTSLGFVDLDNQKFQRGRTMGSGYINQVYAS